MSLLGTEGTWLLLGVLAGNVGEDSGELGRGLLMEGLWSPK